jgi:hypothetical protein
VTGLTNGTLYNFVLRNFNGFNSAISSIVPATVVGPPGAPTINSITVSSGQAVIAFTGTNSGSPITGYQYSINGGANWTPTILTTSTSIINMTSATSGSITVTNLTNGTTYVFRIIAVNTMGVSTPSNSFSKFVDVAPGAPTITGVTVSSGKATVAFTAGTNNGSQISSYEYSKDNGSTWVSVGTSNTITVSGLTNGAEYPFLVRAVNTKGAGAVSNVFNKKVIPTLLELKNQNALKSTYTTYGYQLQDLVSSALHTLYDLKEKGYTLNDLKTPFTPNTLINSGFFNSTELKGEGLISSGITYFITVVVSDNAFSLNRIYSLNDTNEEIIKYIVLLYGEPHQTEVGRIPM